MREESDMSSRQPRRRRPAARALIVATGLILTSCTSGSAGVHLQTADPPSSTAADLTSSTVDTSTISTPQPVLSSTPSPVSSSKTSPSTATAATEVPATATAHPWPASFTLAQQAAAKSALTAFNGYLKVSAAANANPSAKDWTNAIRLYAADPTAAQLLQAVLSLKTAKVREAVSPSFSHIMVKSADAKKVVVQACSDGSKTALVDLAGKPVHFQQQANPRTVLTYNMYMYGSKYGGWLVGETIVPKPPLGC